MGILLYYVYRLIKGADMNFSQYSFTQYMLDFYGPDGVYPLGFTSTQIGFATQLYKCRLADGQEFCGDSIDREAVRDIILAAREETVPEYAKI
jgi:hypothetical protein